MFQTKQNEIAIKVAKWIFPKFDNYELILGVIFLISLILKISFKIPTEVIMTMTLVTLSVLYFFIGFADIQNEENTGFERFMLKIASWSCSISIVGFLFEIMSWPGSELTTLYGLITSLGSLIIIFILNLRKPDQKVFNSRWFVRLLILSAILISFKLLPKESLIDLGIKNTIEYSESE